jgi:hypothetical protein
MTVSFISAEHRTIDLSQVTDKLYHIMLYGVYLTWAELKLTTSVVIDTDCINSCKSSYHTTTTTAAPYNTMAKRKRTSNDLQNTTQKIKDWATRTQLKTWEEHRYYLLETNTNPTEIQERNTGVIYQKPTRTPLKTGEEHRCYLLETNTNRTKNRRGTQVLSIRNQHEPYWNTGEEHRCYLSETNTNPTKNRRGTQVLSIRNQHEPH